VAATGVSGPILCGVDESAHAAQAARLAADLAVRLGVRLVLLHVAPEPWVSAHTPDHHEELQKEMAFERAGHLATVLDPIDVGPIAPVQRAVEFGHPVEVMRASATELGATCLVVGSRGQGAVEEVLVGSTSGALAREAPCPVILVPGEPAAWNERSADDTIVCGVDGSDSSLAAARKAGELAQRLDARLVLATVFETLRDEAPDTVVEEIRAAAPDVRISFESLNGAPSNELLELARRREARLVVVGSRGRSPVRGAVLGSVSARVVQEADRPVMVVSKRATPQG
jgi:nucleotide-binding universal stress UspA family protein